MRKKSCSMAVLVGVAALAFASLGCKSGGGVSTHSTGSFIGSTGGQTVLAPDGGGAQTSGLAGVSGSTTGGGGVAASGGTATEGGRGGAGAPGGVTGTTTNPTASAGSAGQTGGVTGTAGVSGAGGISITSQTTGATGGRAGGSSATGTLSKGGSNGSSGGAVASGGISTASGTGTTPATGGSTIGCAGCQAQETCWTDSARSRCIAAPVTVSSKISIDATEVTRGQYAAWLATKPSTAGQAATCAWNTSFAPDATCMANPSVCQGDVCATHPQPCIDMCDAAAYCQALGRALCSDQDWLNACTSDGKYATIYGSSSTVARTCNDYTAAGSTTVPVASKTNCQAPAGSPFAGVYDLIGNVEEWVDNCLAATGATDVCKPRGLPFGQGAAAPLCRQSTYAERSEGRDTLGFRCCGR